MCLHKKFINPIFSNPIWSNYWHFAGNNMIYSAYCHSAFLLRVFSIPLLKPLRKKKSRTSQKGKDALEKNEAIILCTAIQDKNILHIDSKMKNKTIPKQSVTKCLPSTFYNFLFVWVKKQNIFWNDKTVWIRINIFVWNQFHYWYVR